MRQLTLATGTFEIHSKQTRREKFLTDRETVVPDHVGPVKITLVRTIVLRRPPKGYLET